MAFIWMGRLVLRVTKKWIFPSHILIERIINVNASIFFIHKLHSTDFYVIFGCAPPFFTRIFALLLRVFASNAPKSVHFGPEDIFIQKKYNISSYFWSFTKVSSVSIMVTPLQRLRPSQFGIVADQPAQAQTALLCASLGLLPPLPATGGGGIRPSSGPHGPPSHLRGRHEKAALQRFRKETVKKRRRLIQSQAIFLRDIHAVFSVFGSSAGW